MNGATTAWADFPVAARPRPLVVVDSYVRVGSSGFTGAEAKHAFIAGRIDPRVPLPDGVLTLLTSTRNASSAASGHRLTITAVARVEAGFDTDRGMRLLPAFALDVSGARKPVVVLDPSTATWWPRSPTAQRTAGGSATIEPDGLTLHVLAHGGALTEFVECRLTETHTAVLAEPVTRERPAGLRAAHAIGITRPVSGTLTEPLGDRVLIDAAGQPIVVRPEATL